jgi:hypothetical protein
MVGAAVLVLLEASMFDSILKAAVPTAIASSIMHLMRREEERHFGVVAALGCVALGAVIGGTAALLLTPKSGPELREKVAGGARDLTQKASNRIRRTVDEVNGSAQEEAR